MKKKREKLNSNFRLKVISVVLAIVLWYMINYFSDPVIRMTVNNVSVQILHGEVLENQGDTYTVLDNTDTLSTVTVQAKRSIIDKLEAKNIIATADVRQMEKDGSVPINFTTDKYSNSIERITGSFSYVSLRVEPREEKSLALEVDAVGDPAEGYILFEAGAEQNQVILSGPQSYVDGVGRAAASVDISGAERSINSYPDIVLYDADGREITREEMATHKLQLNISSVKVVATIYQTREASIICGREVPIADGYELEGNPEADPSSILIAGPAGILRQTESIEIPASDIAGEPVSANIHKRLRLDKYLPEEIVLADGTEAAVTVFVRVREIEEEPAAQSASTAATAAAAAEEEAE